jgi:FkbM family methyltransferase
MRDIARMYKRAFAALGPVQGFRFATQETSGNAGELPISFEESGGKYRMWARPRSTDLAVFSQVFRQKEYDFSHWKPYSEQMDRHYQAILSAEKLPLIIDGGANVGYSPIWFALRYPRARILAVEPESENFSLLKRNIASFTNIIPIEAALWDEPATVSVIDATEAQWSRRFEVATDGSGVQSITVPQLLKSRDDYAPFIMKLDIEGAETKLFRSHTEWADEFPLIVFEPHDALFHWLGTWQGSAHAFFATLSRRKREYLTRGENIFAFLHPQH